MGIYREANPGHIEATGFAAAGDGITDNASFLVAADAAGYPIYFTAGTYVISSDLALSSPLSFQPGAMLAPDTGVTLTLTGPIVAGPYQIFTGAGTVEFSQGQTAVYPQWWDDDLANDMGAAINSAVGSITNTGGSVRFIPGTYELVNPVFVNTSSNVTFAGEDGATLKAITPGLSIFQVGAGEQSNITIDGLSFNALTTGQAIGLNGANHYGRIAIRNIKTYGIYGVIADSVAELVIEDSFFYGAGRTDCVGVQTNTCGNVTVQRNRFSYIKDNIIINGNLSLVTDFATDHVRVLDNFVDGGFYTQKPDFTGSTGSTYAATTLTDGGASFAGIDINGYVRALPVLESGTGTFTQKSLTDGSATFISSGMKRGYIVKAGSKFAIVATVQSETVLWVEEWLDSATMLPAALPSGSYTAHKVILGGIASFTGTVVTVSRWFDFSTGASSTPAANTLYEITKLIGNYPIAWTARGVIVSRNVTKRGYADQISCFGSFSTISDNIIEDSQDMGITVQFGIRNTITGNVIRHCGNANIVLEGTSDNVVSGNVGLDPCIFQQVNNIGGIYILSNAKRNIVSSNHLEKAECTNATARAILVTDFNTGDGYTELNTIVDNYGVGFGAGTTFLEDGAAVRNNYWINNIGDSVITAGSAVNGAHHGPTIDTTGTYVPTITNVSNVNSTTVQQFQYMRWGTLVHVSGRVDVDFDAGLVVFGISLPVPSDLGAGAAGEVSGVGAAIDGGTASPAATIVEDATNDRAEFHCELTSFGPGVLAFNVIFSYNVQ